MENYDVYWKEEYIGRLTVDTTTGKHSYEPNSEGIAKVAEKTVLLVEMASGTNGFVNPIPFFQTRLQNMKRLELKELRYHTDYFVIRKCQ